MGILFSILVSTQHLAIITRNRYTYRLVLIKIQHVPLNFLDV